MGGYLASVPERCASCQSCVQAPLVSDRKLHLHLHTRDGRARAHTPTHSLAASGRLHTGGGRFQEERGEARQAPAVGTATPKKRPHRVKEEEEDWTDEEAISALALPTPLCLAQACQRTRKKRGRKGGDALAFIAMDLFIYLSIDFGLISEPL